jgi:hypothetical protein
MLISSEAWRGAKGADAEASQRVLGEVAGSTDSDLTDSA